jgi:high-affinity Fe2+/Pb2+ permease
MVSSSSPASEPPDLGRWSLYAGVYAFGCGAVTAGLLSTVLRVFTEVIGLPASFPVPLLAAPALLVGGGVWWLLVERRAAYTYPAGIAFGALTALLTGLCWTAWFLVVWSVDLLAAGPTPLLVALVIGLTTAAGALIGPPITFLRRRRRAGSETDATANSL